MQWTEVPVSRDASELEHAYFEKLRTPATWSGIPTKPLYGPNDVAGLDYARDLEDPGEYPFTRGVYADMYRGRLWTRREVCGFGSPQDTNRRLRFQTEQGVSGLSVIDDNNGSLGIGADHPMGVHEAGAWMSSSPGPSRSSASTMRSTLSMAARRSAA